MSIDYKKINFEDAKKLVQNLNKIRIMLTSIQNSFNDGDSHLELFDLFNIAYKPDSSVDDLLMDFRKTEIRLREELLFNWKETFNKSNCNDFEDDSAVEFLEDGKYLLVIKCKLSGLWYWLDENMNFGSEVGNGSECDATAKKVENWLKQHVNGLL